MTHPDDDRLAALFATAALRARLVSLAETGNPFARRLLERLDAVDEITDPLAVIEDVITDVAGQLAAALLVAYAAVAPLEDDDPETCWRCNAVKAENRLGTCARCLEDLKT